tara:strand:+ start:6619 stop:6876 length:258 start_codon:yes stop_codon:yes gene_type:complete
VIDMAWNTVLPFANEKTVNKLQDLSNTVNERRSRIKEQYISLLEIDVMLSDDPLVPTTEEMIDAYVEQELMRELKEEYGVIVRGK